MEINARFVDWTPEMAKKVLEENNTSNRPLSEITVRTYANIMRAGDWDENALDPIVINRYGVLENGQHRLRAVVLAKKTVRMWTITGSQQTFGSFDRGKTRSISDVININGFVGKISSKHVSVATLMLKRYGLLYTRNDALVQEYIVSNERQIKESVSIGTTLKGKTRGKSFPVSRAPIHCALYMALKLNYEPDKLKHFMSVLSSGFYSNECETSAVVLRNMMINDERTKISSYEKRVWLSGITSRAIIDFCKERPRKLPYTEPVDTLFEATKALDMDFIVCHSMWAV